MITYLGATNTNLIIGMIIGIVFFLVFGYAFFKSLIRFLNRKERKTKFDFKIIINLFFCGVGIYIMLLEYNILYKYEYVEGITIDYCKPSSRSKKGIEFRYYFNGKEYKNCNSYENKNKIKVPGGKFKVRVSEFAPKFGRIDFNKPLFIDNRSGK